MSLWTFPYITAHAAGLTAFDMRPTGYSVQEARAFLRAIDQSGISLYKRVQLPLDIPFPALQCLFFIATLALASKLSGEAAPPRQFRWLALLPVIGMLGDYCENACVFLMLSDPLGSPDVLLRTANACTLVKSLGTTFSWLGIIVVAIRSLATKLRRNRKS